MTRLVVLLFVFLSLIGCDRSQAVIEKVNREETKTTIEDQNTREKEEKEFQAMFENKKWAVIDAEISEGYDFLTFKTLGGGYFVCDIFKVNVVLDESLDGSFLTVKKAGHARLGIFQNKRDVDEAILYVSKKKNKDAWEKYLIKNRARVKALAEYAKEVFPPERGR